MTVRVLVLNGPNLNLLGRRDPGLYGSTTLGEVEAELRAVAGRRGASVDCRQSNDEGVLIDAAQEAMDGFDAVIVNAGGYSHTSVALRDALAMLPVPVVEVHITNIHAREEFRHFSYVSTVARAVIAGAGTGGYLLALDHALALVGADAASPGPAVDPPAGERGVLVLNGPNLNALGRREPEIYGTVTLAQIERRVAETSRQLGLAVDFRQSNSEAVLIDAVQEAMDGFGAVIVNPAGFSFGSVGLRDALAMLPVPVIEVHLTNIMARPAHYLHRSLISPIADAVIMGAGPHGYELALHRVADLLVTPETPG